MTQKSPSDFDFIDHSPMTWQQILIVVITIFFSAVDGFDVLAIAVSGSGIMQEFALSRAELGGVLSMELIGMAIGSIFLGGISDKIGRRGLLLGCLFIMSVGMACAANVSNVVELSVVRVFTGLGIGGLLSSTNAVVAEFSNNKHRALAISLFVVGYPFGGILCGAFGHALLDTTASNWRDMFVLGAVLSALLIPATYFFVPESVTWLARVQPNNALIRINKALRQIGHIGLEQLPNLPSSNATASVWQIFSRKFFALTLLMTLAYLFQMITFYYILKWTPTIVVQMGIGAASAAGVLFWVNVGGVLGGLTFGMLSQKVGLKRLSILTLLLTTCAVALFGQSGPNLATLSAFAAIAGFFANAGISGIYTMMAVYFPTDVRATGTGFVIGMGRAGAILSPWLAGILMQQGIEGGQSLNEVLASVAATMGLCAAIAAVALYLLPSSKSTPSSAVIANA